jgi:pimeloyl-ACP methyl ester carboxylesterase
LYVRDFPGSGPAFVVLHGFPDNSHIYDDLIPHLVSAGRRTVAMDFLGFGASDKPEDALYNFEQRLGDLEAVVEALRLEEIIPVGHDAGGPTAVNFALRHPDRTAAVTLINAFYGDAPGLRVPEWALTRALAPAHASSRCPGWGLRCRAIRRRLPAAIADIAYQNKAAIYSTGRQAREISQSFSARRSEILV